MNVQTIETTQFVDDGQVEAVAYTAPLPMELHDETTSIAAFLRKPKLLAFDGITGLQWKNQVSGTLLAYVDPLFELVNTPMWMEKVRGYNLLRATAVLQLKFNANPFQQGAIIGHFLTQGQLSLTQTRNCCLGTISLQPHVIADCRDTGLTLEIPYVSVFDWIEFHDDIKGTGWGRFFITVLSGLKTSDNTGVDISVFLHFEDLELCAPITPESGRKSNAKFGSRKMSCESILPTVSSVLSKGPVVGSFADIPSLPEVKPSWMLELMAKAASVNGWSKPKRGVDNVTSFDAPSRYGASADGEIPFMPLGLKSDNAIVPAHDSIYEGDEMAFNFLKTREMYIGDTTWTTNQPVGSLLYTYLSGPSWEAQNVSRIKGAKKLTGRVLHPSSVLAQHMNQWRGSYKIRMKVVKTQMHTGRLMVTYSPTTDPLVAPSLEGSMFSIRQIVDLSTTDEFEFHLPFLLSRQYLGVDMHSGKFAVTVLNALKGPTTVAQEVSILWFLSCGDDFELQVPGIGPAMIPITMESGRGKTVLSLPEDTQRALAPSTRCVGESFSSVKQFLVRNSPLYEKIRTNNSSQNFTLMPFAFSVIGLDAGGGLTWYGKVGGDPYNLYSAFYAFYRGGMRITATRGPQFEACCAPNFKIATMTPLINVSPIKVSNLDLGIAANLADESFGPVGLSSAYMTIPMEIPYYCQTKMSSVLASPAAIGAQMEDSTQPSSNCSVFQDGITPVNFRRACRDDFQFLYFIGVPILFVSYTDI